MTEKDIKNRLKTMDRILVIIALAVVIFTAGMVLLFIFYQAIPDTLCACFFALCGTECGAMAWIKTTKERLEDKLEEKQHDE